MRDIPWKLENPHKITEEELAALEERFGFKMPEDDMRQFYLHYNGGILPLRAKIDPEGDGLIANSFPEFLEMVRFPGEEQ